MQWRGEKNRCDVVFKNHSGLSCIRAIPAKDTSSREINLAENKDLLTVAMSVHGNT